ncbi:MAG: rhamnose ABC transporter substrate-binding protein [Synergistaceae bacterium]|jgi:rhamnose transport system substrate-binding protein|nr:rhamnose ABC transporter substrate-binding protein [Synergistaceae bacterium]
MRKNILMVAALIVVIAGGIAVFFAFGKKTPEAPLIAQQPNVSARGKKITIYFIPKNLGNVYFEALSTGFYDAISELGDENFKYVYSGPQVAEADNQIEFVKKAIQDKADALFISANSNTALNSVFDEARAAGVRVYIINQDIPGSEAHRDAAIMPVNFDTIGRAQMELMGEQMGYEGSFAILSATVDAPDQNTWVGLMKKELEDNPKYAKMELVEVVYGDDQLEKSAAEAKALLSKYPDLKGILSPTTVGIAAACQVVRESGMSGKIKVTGLGLPSQMAEFILDGTCEGFQLWNPPYEGYISVYMVWAEKKEGFTPVPGAKFTTRKLGEYTIQPNGQILTLENPMLYDKSNIGKYSVLF